MGQKGIASDEASADWSGRGGRILGANEDTRRAIGFSKRDGR